MNQYLAIFFAGVSVLIFLFLKAFLGSSVVALADSAGVLLGVKSGFEHSTCPHCRCKGGVRFIKSQGSRVMMRCDKCATRWIV